MNSKLMLKWICIGLMCAALFGSIGYAYGAMTSTNTCNQYWAPKLEVCNQLLKDNSQTVVPDKYKININYTPIEAQT